MLGVVVAAAGAVGLTIARRVRYDTIDRDGKITIRHSGRLLHLGIGTAHARTEITALIHNNEATIACQTTGQVLAEFTLDPTRNYQRKNS